MPNGVVGGPYDTTIAAQTHPVRVVAVTSGKGGVGKTTVSANIAIAMADAGHRVMLLDADLGLANVDVMLGLEARFNLSHVISGERRLDEIMLAGPAGVRIVPGAAGVKRMSQLGDLETAGLIRAFSELAANVDVLLVDTAAGLSNSVVSFSRGSQEVIVVVCDEPASICDAHALMGSLSRDHEVNRFRILANMTRGAGEGRELFGKITRIVDKDLNVMLDYLGSVPYDESLRKAVKRQRAVVHAYPRSRAAMAFKNLAKKAENWRVPERAGGQVEFFVERLIQYTSTPGELTP
jgi:flagellar biosynthesis protein FlhG